MCFDHLKKRNIHYGDHLKQAWRVSWKFWKAGWAMVLHGLWPPVYKTTATDTCHEVLDSLHNKDRKKRY